MVISNAGAMQSARFPDMDLITILNRCHRFRGFVYQYAYFSADKKSIEVAVRPRKGSAAICSRCHLPAPGYDQLAERRFEFIPLWGFFVFVLYTMRRVDCRRCGVVAVDSPRVSGRMSRRSAAEDPGVSRLDFGIVLVGMIGMHQEIHVKTIRDGPAEGVHQPRLDAGPRHPYDDVEDALGMMVHVNTRSIGVLRPEQSPSN